MQTLIKLRDLGNTVIVIEHDEATMRIADYIVDLGPGAGIHGGYLVERGSIKDIIKNKKSITGKYLNHHSKIDNPHQRRKGNGKYLEIFGAHQFNLKSIDVSIPLGTFTCITGVSGSGKSTLVEETLYKALIRKIYKLSLIHI